MRVMKTLTFDLAGLGWTGQVAPPRKLFLNWTIVLLKNDVFLLLVSKRSSNEPMKTTSRYGLGCMLLKLLSFVTRHHVFIIWLLHEVLYSEEESHNMASCL